MNLGHCLPNFKQLYQPDEQSFWSNQCKIPLALRRNKSTSCMFRITKRRFFPCKLVVTIHDCVHLLFPQEDSSKFRKHRSYLANEEDRQARETHSDCFEFHKGEL